MASQQVRVLQPGELERLCKVLADTESGLTGSQIGQMLAQARIEDTDSSITKWKRLRNALGHRQANDGAGNCVLSFIRYALEPARFLALLRHFVYGRW